MKKFVKLLVSGIISTTLILNGISVFANDDIAIINGGEYNLKTGEFNVKTDKGAFVQSKIRPTFENNDDVAENLTEVTGGYYNQKTKEYNIITKKGTFTNTEYKFIKLTIGNKTANVNGKDVIMDVEPYIQAKTNSTMIPLKFVATILGIDENNIKFDAKIKSIKITKDEDIIEFFVGDNRYKQNGTWSFDVTRYGMTAPVVEIKNGRTFVPFRTLGEAFGLEVEWDNSTRTAIMKKGYDLSLSNNDKNENKEDLTEKNIRAIEEKVIKLVNQERAKFDLPPLELDETLMNCAKLKVEDMVENNYFEHTSPTYGTVSNMMKQYNIKYSIVGENIAAGYSTAESVVNGWMNSKGHKENILCPEFKYIGVGLKDNTWAQIFRG